MLVTSLSLFRFSILIIIIIVIVIFISCLYSMCFLFIPFKSFLFCDLTDLKYYFCIEMRPYPVAQQSHPLFSFFLFTLPHSSPTTHNDHPPLSSFPSLSLLLHTRAIRGSHRNRWREMHRNANLCFNIKSKCLFLF